MFKNCHQGHEEHQEDIKINHGEYGVHWGFILFSTRNSFPCVPRG